MIVALVIGAHGVGHLIGVVGAIRPRGMTWGGSSESWLLSPALGPRTWIVEVVLFSIPTIGWLTAAVLLLAGNDAWQPVAIGSSIASLLAIALFPGQLQLVSAIGAVAVNVIALVGLVLLGWPSSGAVAP